jgi:hypothetical protein
MKKFPIKADSSNPELQPAPRNRIKMNLKANIIGVDTNFSRTHMAKKQKMAALLAVVYFRVGSPNELSIHPKRHCLVRQFAL